MIARMLLAVVLAVFVPQSLAAQELSGLARVLPGSTVSDTADGIDLRLKLSQPVPYRVFQLTDPWRLVVDFREVNWSASAAIDMDRSERVTALRSGAIRAGWSRLVLELAGPFGLRTANLVTGPEGATLDLKMSETGADDFAANAGAPDDGSFLPALPGQVAPPRPGGRDGPLVIMLDPGHGGIDPGAEVDGAVEARLMLQFARELKEVLVRDGGFDVRLTRNSDEFIPLESRVSDAHAADADVFISLHADVVPEGRATGATVYTLDAEASDLASKKLAERHDRADLLAGVDLTHQDDEVALALMGLARAETAHRTDALADALVAGLNDKVELYKNPHLHAGFSVLKAPDIPSVLIELGFMSLPHDLKNLRDPNWRALAAEGIRDGLIAWEKADAAERDLRRH